jgi:hypothetical protein
LLWKNYSSYFWIKLCSRDPKCFIYTDALTLRAGKQGPTSRTMAVFKGMGEYKLLGKRDESWEALKILGLIRNIISELLEGSSNSSYLYISNKEKGSKRSGVRMHNGIFQ